jgi:DNA polymerase IV (archaeal DinB-like DNA polymerase)
MKYYVGCSGWKNQHWTKDFYPTDLDSKYFLSYYSKIFNFVHVDMNDNPIPTSSLTLQRWSEDTAEEFHFSIKMPQYIVEGRYGGSKIKSVGDFLESLTPLKNKILCIIISPPNTMSLNDEGRNWIESILNECTFFGYSVVFDFNNSSWYQDLTYNILKKYHSSFVWSDTGYKYYYPAVTSDFIFLKLSGNTFEKNHNKSRWIKLIKQKEEEFFSLGDENKKLNFAVIVVNTPSNINSINGLLNLHEQKLYDSQNQSTLLWTGKVIMHVDMNAFFPACEEIRDPSLRGKPHAVIMTPERGGNITRGAVASCSYEARTYGVRSAMSLLKAKELCPHIILKPVDKQYYGQISDQVMMLLEEYADILEKASIDEAYLDCTNKIVSCQHDHSMSQCSQTPRESEKNIECVDSVSNSEKQRLLTVEAYALKIKNSIREQCSGLVCSIGVAPTKSAAKIASDYKKPDGLTVVYSKNLLQFLEPLEANKISGIGLKTSQILKEMGIKTIGQLAKCDVQNLIERFGKKNGLWMWHVANGEEHEPVIPREDSISISTEKTLLKPYKDKKAILEFLVNELVNDLYKKVKGRGYEFKTVGIKLVRTNFGLETRETTFSTYRTDKESIASVMESLLEKFQLDEINNPDNLFSTVGFSSIRKLGIKASNLSKIDKKKLPLQKTLFDYM